MNEHRILVINPGSTSTKIAVFHGEKRRLDEQIFHPAGDLSPFGRTVEQYPFRERVITDLLHRERIDVHSLGAVVGRGGMLTPMESGTYLVTDEMVEYLENSPVDHASNLGAILAYKIARPLQKKAFIVDPIVVDEMDDLARVTGVPEIGRLSVFHALNQKAAARKAAEELKSSYESVRLIVVHLGGGISVAAHRNGRVIDVNNALNGEGPMGPERAGSVPAWQLIELALSGRYDREALRMKIAGRGGIVAHCGTNDLREIKRRILKGDEKCERVYRAMAYQVAKEVGAMAAVLEGRVDAVVFTGGLANDGDFLTLIASRVSFLSSIIVLPGEDEMTSLAQGALRVLKGEERVKRWRAPVSSGSCCEADALL